MSDKASTKKRIYHVAKELNISHETLIQYLKKRGHAVIGHMSLITDAMMHDIQSHFKREKEDVEKHLRKIQTLRDSRKKKDIEATQPQEVISAAKISKKKKVEDKIPVEVSDKPEIVEVEQPKVVETPSIIETPPVTEVPPIQEPEVKPEQEIQPPITETEQVKPPSEVQTIITEQKTDQKTDVESVKPPPVPEPKPVVPLRLTPKFELKIKGKINIEETKPPTTVEPVVEPQPEKVVEMVVEERVVKKKKKKKRVKLSARDNNIEEVDELLLKAKKKKKLKHYEVSQEDVEEAIKRTLSGMDETVPFIQRNYLKKKKKEKRAAEEQRQLELVEKEKFTLKVTPFITVNDLALMMHVNVSDVIKKCIELGMMVSINQRLDQEMIILVADEFGYNVEFQETLQEDILEDSESDSQNLEPRPPVVTIMGHVDHGKTSLLDYIRQSNIVAGEIGGITQHIGAYSVELENGRHITFLDTPGHEAFTAMRARGAQVTDIVVLVVAADDNVMPQTVEAISHAQAAGVPIIVAINKCDKADANPDRIRQQLAERNILVEEWGGKYQCVEISARTGKNVNLLLEKILLEADTLELLANPHRLAKGVIIEAKVDKGKGIIATVLVQKGTLKIGDPFVAGIQSGSVRALFDERMRRIELVKPSMSAQVIGFDGVPQAGDTLVVVKDERTAREISLKRQMLKREQDLRLLRSFSLADISKKIKDGVMKELKVIVKGDVDGSVGALADSLMKIKHEEVRINVIHRAVGAITESDVLLAAASGGIIIGFHVRPNLNARRLAEQERVDIRLYDIIYDAIDDVKKALEGLLSPVKKEEVTATIEVREVFKIPKVGTIGGCYVQDGKIQRNNKVRVIRDGIIVFEGGLRSLKRFKDDVREVEAGFECGICIENYNDLKVGDIIEAYKIVETQRSLS